jgi:hypothetical protein
MIILNLNECVVIGPISSDDRRKLRLLVQHLTVTYLRSSEGLVIYFRKVVSCSNVCRNKGIEVYSSKGCLSVGFHSSNFKTSSAEWLLTDLLFSKLLVLLIYISLTSF